MRNLSSTYLVHGTTRSSPPCRCFRYETKSDRTFTPPPPVCPTLSTTSRTLFLDSTLVDISLALLSPTYSSPPPNRREAGNLRQLLAEGIAPEPPKFWSAKPGHPDVGHDDDALTDELLLCWRPQHGSAVRMFNWVVETEGVRNAGTSGTHNFCAPVSPREMFPSTGRIGLWYFPHRLSIFES